MGISVAPVTGWQLYDTIYTERFMRTPEENLHRVIGETIRGLRKDRGLTLKQMARRTGLSVSLLSQIERAESSPPRPATLIMRTISCWAIR